MSGPAVEKCENETMYSLPLTMYGVILGMIGTGWPLTSTGTCQSRLPVFSSYAWIIPTPLGYCGVATVLPIRARPLAVIVTRLAHGAALPFAKPPVDTSSCFQTILFVAGLNATSRAIVKALGGVDDRNCVMLPKPFDLITGLMSSRGGDSKPALCTFAQTIWIPLFGSHAPSGHSTPPPAVGAFTTYCWSVYGVNGCVPIT